MYFLINKLNEDNINIPHPSAHQTGVAFHPLITSQQEPTFKWIFNTVNQLLCTFN